MHFPGQSKKKDGKSSQPKKTKVKKEERDLDLEDSELGTERERETAYTLIIPQTLLYFHNFSVESNFFHIHLYILYYLFYLSHIRYYVLYSHCNIHSLLQYILSCISVLYSFNVYK